jgi:hypothetical protein
VSTKLHGPVADLHRIRAVLNSIGDALAQGRFDLVTAAETELDAALRAAGAARHLGTDSAVRASLRTEILETRAALDRCRRLGASLTEFVRCSLAAQGRCGAYDRTGREAIAARVGAIDARG